MFKKSFLMVLGIITVVFISAFTTQMVLSGQLPSAYDPGISVDEAFKTSKHPLLIEFYSDTCSSCRTVTPLIHQVYDNQYTDKLTLVMVDINDQDGYQISQLFGVESIPAVFTFDFKQMKKNELKTEDLFSRKSLVLALDTALNQAEKEIGKEIGKKEAGNKVEKRMSTMKPTEARGVK